jgi:hypothetical protein
LAAWIRPSNSAAPAIALKQPNPRKNVTMLYARCARVVTHIRRILGVLSLAKKFGTAATEDACAAAWN